MPKTGPPIVPRYRPASTERFPTEYETPRGLLSGFMTARRSRAVMSGLRLLVVLQDAQLGVQALGDAQVVFERGRPVRLVQPFDQTLNL